MTIAPWITRVVVVVGGSVVVVVVLDVVVGSSVVVVGSTVVVVATSVVVGAAVVVIAEVVLVDVEDDEAGSALGSRVLVQPISSPLNTTPNAASRIVNAALRRLPMIVLCIRVAILLRIPSLPKLAVGYKSRNQTETQSEYDRARETDGLFTSPSDPRRKRCLASWRQFSP
jgi:hypothetical protein